MQIKTQPDELADYLTDASNMPGGNAAQLFLPETEQDVIDAVREAYQNSTPITVTAGRTGTVGGAIPFGGVLISTERLSKIESIDEEALCARVQPGVVLGDLQKAVEEKGLFYPPDPTEWSCQIGGTIATNASGARSFKYGSTRNFVRSLRVVLADGETLGLTRGEFVANGPTIELTTEQGTRIVAKIPSYMRPSVRKNVAGYYNQAPLDAVDLFIGSEGTLGIVTQAELELLKKPAGFFSGIVFFRDEKDILKLVDAARERSFRTRESEGGDIDATLLEYFDANSLKFISEKFPETPKDAVGAIFFEQETTEADEDHLLEQWNEMLETGGADLDRSWFTTTEQDREKMRAFRHALPVAVNERVVRNKQKKIGTDMAVPDDKFPAFLRFYKEILDGSGLEYVIFGHIGDDHLHANMLPRNAEEAEKARHVYGRCIAQAIMLGGTISAEHGIGKLKSRYLNVMMGERYLNEMAELKRAFDPQGLLGRGNMFDAKLMGDAK